MKKMISLLMAITMMFVFAACYTSRSDGKDGNNGKSAYEIWLDNGHTGTEADFLQWLKGEDGDGGKDGNAGLSAYEIAVKKGYTGTETEWLALLVGAKGETGKNAYEVAVDNGYTGTQAEWLEMLIGAKGETGKNAYQIAINNGFEGTETEWLMSLMGKDGDDGLSAYEIYKKYYDYDGTEKEWLDDLTNGRLSELGKYKTSVKEVLESYAQGKGQSNYSEENWAVVCKAVTDGKQAIESATSNDGVDTAYKTATDEIDAVERKYKMISINFTLILGRMDYGVDTCVEAIIGSFAEWSELGEVTNLPELRGQFNEQYFESRSLIVFALRRGNRGAQLKKVEVFRLGNELLVKVFDNEMAHMDMVSNWIVVLEVKKADISSFSSLRLETNFYSFSFL